MSLTRLPFRHASSLHRDGLEPSTLCLSNIHSNLLSYRWGVRWELNPCPYSHNIKFYQLNYLRQAPYRIWTCNLQFTKLLLCRWAKGVQGEGFEPTHLDIKNQSLTTWLSLWRREDLNLQGINPQIYNLPQ